MAVSMVLLRISIVVPRLLMLEASTNIRVSASTSSTSTAIAANTSTSVKALRLVDGGWWMVDGRKVMNG